MVYPILRNGIRQLLPGYFALVMATGIVSVAVGSDGAAGLSAALLVLGIVCYLVLIACYSWRFASYRREFMADATGPRTAFSLFTFTAASDVLGSRLAGGVYHTATVVLLVVVGTTWLLLSYGVPLVLITGHSSGSALAGISGNWFLWAVGTQSLAVDLASLKPPLASPARGGCGAVVGGWGDAISDHRQAGAGRAAAFLRAASGAAPRVLGVHGRGRDQRARGRQATRAARRPAADRGALCRGRPVGDLGTFGTWLIPLLIGLGAWRHLIRRVTLGYDPGLWSMVFPPGMYCVASEALGTALHVKWLVTVGRDGAWVAFAVWAALFPAMLAFLAGFPRSHLAPGQR